MRRILLVLCLLSASAAWATPEDDAKKLMDRGVKAFSQGKYSDAVLAFNHALDILPDAAGPHRELGKCFQKLNDLDSSIHHYTKYLTQRPDAQERSTIETLIISMRLELPTKGRALLTVTASPGAAVYAYTEAGEERGLGISPIVRHPLEPRFTQLRLVSAGAPIETKMTLVAAQDLTITDKDFASTALLPNNPIKVEPTTVPAKNNPIAVSNTPSSALSVAPPTKAEEGQASALPAVAALGVSGLSLGAAVFFDLRMQKTADEMNAKIAQLDGASIADKRTLSAELSDLDAQAHRSLYVSWASGGVAAVTAATGALLLVKAKHAPETTAKLLLSPQSAQVAVSF